MPASKAISFRDQRNGSARRKCVCWSLYSGGASEQTSSLTSQMEKKVQCSLIFNSYRKCLRMRPFLVHEKLICIADRYPYFKSITLRQTIEFSRSTVLVSTVNIALIVHNLIGPVAICHKQRKYILNRKQECES